MAATAKLGGLTRQHANGNVSVHIAPARFKKAIRLYMTVGHELHHAIHFSSGAIFWRHELCKRDD